MRTAMYLRISSEDADLRTAKRTNPRAYPTSAASCGIMCAAMQIYPALKYWNFVMTVGVVRISSVQL